MIQRDLQDAGVNQSLGGDTTVFGQFNAQHSFGTINAVTHLSNVKGDAFTSAFSEYGVGKMGNVSGAIIVYYQYHNDTLEKKSGFYSNVQTIILIAV